MPHTEGSVQGAQERGVEYGDRGLSTRSRGLGVLSWEKWARNWDREGWTGQRRQGLAWQPEFRTTPGAGALGRRRARGLSLCTTPAHLLRIQARLASSSTICCQPHPLALELRDALKLGDWSPKGGQDGRVPLVHARSSPKVLWSPLRSISRITNPLGQKASGAPYWQLCINTPIPQSRGRP